jgi:hypothetical protein
MTDGVTNSTSAPADQAGAASDSADSAAQTEFAKTLSQQAQTPGDQAPVSTNGGAELQNPDTGPYKKVGGDHVHQVASRTSNPGAARETAPQFRDAQSVSTKNPAYADKAGQKVEGAINRAAWGRDYNGKPAGSSGKVTLQATGNTAVGSSKSATPSPWFEDTKSYYKLQEAGKTPDEAARLVTSSGEQLAKAGATPQRVPNAPRNAPANLKAGQTLSNETPTTKSVTAQKGLATEAGAAELPKTANLPQAAKADQAATTVAQGAKADQTVTTVTQGAKAEGTVSQAAKLEQAASKGAQVAKAESTASKVLAPVAKVLEPVAPALKVAGKVAGPVGAALSAHALGEDIAKGDVAAAVSDGAGTVSGGLETFALASGALGAGEAATGAAALAAEAAPVVAAAGVGVAVGTYINNHTGISDTAASAGMWVEKHTGGSMIAGATAAAATSIVTAPYYAGVAAVDAGAGALKSVKDWF